MPRLIKGNHPRWRSNEIEQLLRLPKGLTLAEKARLLGRTRQAVACKLSDLKRRQLGRKRLGNKRGRLHRDRPARMMQLAERIIQLKRWQEQQKEGVTYLTPPERKSYEWEVGRSNHVDRSCSQLEC